MPESEVAQRLLAAATAVIEESGEASLRVQEIVDVAGVQAPVLYRHFGNREGLVQSSILARYITELTDETTAFSLLTSAAESEKEFRSNLDALVRSAADPSRREHRRARLEVIASSMSRPELSEMIRSAQASAYAPAVEALSDAQKRGWIRPEVEPVSFVAWASSSMLGLAAVEQYGTDPDPAGWWLDHMAEAIAVMLFGDS